MKLMKKMACLLLAGCLALSVSACSTDNSWAMRRGDTTLPIGVYIYYLYQSFLLTGDQVDQDTEILKATIDGIPAETYIRDKANVYCKSVFWLDQTLSDLGLTLTEEELSAAQQVTDAQWAALKESLEKSGVSKESFHTAYALYNAKYRKVFMALYGTGGTQEVPMEEVAAYYQENSYAYSFLFAPLYQTAEETAGEPLTEEEKTALEETFQSYKEQIDAGSMSIAEAGEDYAAKINLTESPVNTMVNSKDYLYFPAGFADALESLSDGGLAILESEGNLVLLQKLSMEEATEKLTDSPSQLENVLLTMKGPGFSEELADRAAKEITDATVNSSALNSLKLQNIVDPSMLLGTKPTAAE